MSCAQCDQFLLPMTKIGAKRVLANGTALCCMKCVDVWELTCNCGCRGMNVQMSISQLVDLIKRNEGLRQTTTDEVKRLIRVVEAAQNVIGKNHAVSKEKGFRSWVDS